MAAKHKVRVERVINVALRDETGAHLDTFERDFRVQSEDRHTAIADGCSNADLQRWNEVYAIWLAAGGPPRS